MNAFLIIPGMNCSNCAGKVREALQSVPGVEDIRIDVPAKRVTIEAPDSLENAVLLKALSDAGYPVKEFGFQENDSEKSPTHAYTSWAFHVILSLSVAAFLFGAEAFTDWMHADWFRWTSLVLGTVVQLVVGAEFYQGAWAQLKRFRANMDTLVSLGSTAAYGWSVWTFSAHHEHPYFAEAAAILGVVALGHGLEARWSQKATQALHGLLQSVPNRARVRNPEGRWEELSVAMVRVGDLLQISPGDQIPVDGVLREGAGAVDESVLNGEPLPVEKAVGDSVYAGTLNQQWSFVYEARALGRDTALQQIVRAVERAQGSKAKIQRLADRVSAVFVPIVLVVALGTFVYGYQSGDMASAVRAAVAVLIVACPCAMGIATPVALAAALQVAARRGVIVREATALETCGRIGAVYFDKTGTLTEGRPEARLLKTWPGAGDASALTCALAQPSRHPLSRSLHLLVADAPKAEVLAWSEQPGAGVSAVFESKPVRLGSLTWLEKCGVIIPAVPSEATGTLVGLAVGNELRAVYEIQDAVKPHAAAAVAALRKAGLIVGLISGDREKSVKALAQTVGIDPAQVYAGVRPEEKAALILKAQNNGKTRVAFLGDGINDGPALAQADLGIAVLKASDVARESAAISLLRADIEIVADLIVLSRRTRSIIWQNLFWAFAYNAALIPLAATGHLAPGWCAVAMGLSDLCVVGNSLRLLRGQKQPR